MVYNMNNGNICCNYILSYIITTNILLYIASYNKNTLSCMKKYLLSLYTLLYNDNKYFFIHESVFHVLQDDIFLLIRDDV